MRNSIKSLFDNIDRRTVRSIRSRSYRSGRRKTNRIVRHPTMLVQDWEFNPIIMKENRMSSVYLGASDVRDFKISQWFETYNGDSLICRSLDLLAEKKRWIKFVETYMDTANVFELSDSSGIILTSDGYIDYSIRSTSIDVKFHGSVDFVKTNIIAALEEFEEVSSYIEWMYSSDGNSVRVPMSKEKLPMDEMYPFLGEKPIEQYYDEFMNSSANILVLIGPPGTGKTTFIRGLLSHASTSATVTYDAAILEKDYIFANFIENETNIMVMEDCDRFLSSRTDGNTMMHKFLNIGDGLVTTRGKKLIFSTNLPSVRDIDQALIRPGRCFDVLSFDLLTPKQAEKLANKLDIKLEKKDNYSVAEVFHKQEHKKQVRKVGFI